MVIYARPHARTTQCKLQQESQDSRRWESCAQISRRKSHHTFLSQSPSIRDFPPIWSGHEDCSEYPSENPTEHREWKSEGKEKRGGFSGC